MADDFTFIVIGAGAAGLNAALELAKKGSVLILNKGPLKTNASNWAQGGIAVQGNSLDNDQNHIEDTIKTGCHHNNLKAVSLMVRQSPKIVNHLLKIGTNFDKIQKNLKYSREAGHSLNRIISHADHTGHEIMRSLLKKIRNQKNIIIKEYCFCLDLLVQNKTGIGLQIIHKNILQNIYAPFVIICSGGCGALYPYTTNPYHATGDGIALAKRAGLKLKDLEFIQFHPTALFQKSQKRAFLLSEVLRGEGAILLNSKGERYMSGISEKAELAPRHLVARASFLESQNGPIYLKFPNKRREEIKKRFPHIYAKLAKMGLALEKDLIPIMPAAHYQCGGIATDLFGQTNIKNIYAAGEVACTGVHGANRLASNSLLEALVFSGQISKKITADIVAAARQNLKKIQQSKNPQKIAPPSPLEKKTHRQIRKKIRALMWENVGIIRTEKGLKKAKIEFNQILKSLETIKNKKNFLYFETRNMVEASLAITMSAQKRTQSLGTHYLA